MSVPRDLRNLRACKICSLIKSLDQFEKEGCENCDKYVRMRGNRDMIYDCTSTNFDGIVALMDPKDSWVSKWQHLTTFMPGMYAISVSGELPSGVIRTIREKDGDYRNRDVSQKS